MSEIPKEIRFLALVEMLQNGAMHALGKLADPNNPDGTPHVSLPQAQYMIALLEGLEEKTRGNLNEYEKRALETHLTNLRLNYVDEFNKQKKGGGAKAEEKPAEKPADKPAEKPAEKTDGGFVDKRSSR